jgi:predicted hotdog family 3-hydroxylacyl-ACP dehydratase
MFLLNRVIRLDLAAHSLEAEYDITRDCLFYREALGGVPSWVGFELIAQCVAVFSGLQRREQGLPPRLGFILSVSEMVLRAGTFPEGSAAAIQVEEETVMGAVFAFRGKVLCNGTEMVTAKLTVMEADDIEALTRRARGQA